MTAVFSPLSYADFLFRAGSIRTRRSILRRLRACFFRVLVEESPWSNGPSLYGPFPPYTGRQAKGRCCRALVPRGKPSHLDPPFESYTTTAQQLLFLNWCLKRQ